MCMNGLSRIYREHFVIVSGHDSISLPLICGVPQGSIFGNLLFLLYVSLILYFTSMI